MKRFLLTLLLLTSAFSTTTLFTGCVVAAAGAAGGGVAYAMGSLSDTVRGDVGQVAAATRQALTELGFRIRSDQSDAFEAVFNARTARDQPVTVTIQSVSATTSKVSIRFGRIGNQERSLQVLDAIRERL